MDVVFYYGLYIGGALLLTGLLVLTVGGVLHAGHRRPDGFLMLLGPLLLLLMATTTYLGARNLNLPEDLSAAVAQEGGGAAKWLQRGVMLFLLAASVERLTHFAFSRHQAQRPHGLMLAFAIFWLASVLLPALLGTRPTMGHEFFYALLIGLGALLSTERGAQRAIKLTRDAVVVFILCSLLLLLVDKSLVMAPYTSGIVPGLHLRFYGLSPGPNSMGPLAVLGLISLWCMPYERRWLQRAAWLLAVVALVLTQSKTSWIAAFVCLIVLVLVNHGAEIKRYLEEPRYRLRTQMLLGLLAVGALAAMFLVGSGAVGGGVGRLLDSRLGADLATFTGRNEIWAVAIDTWLRSPWFGYGPAAWDPYFRYQVGYAAAYHAHSQVHNVLAVSGVVGLAAFAAYLFCVGQRLLARLSAFRGYALALATLIVMRSVSEVPILLHSLGSESLVHLLLLMVLAGAPARVVEPSQRRGRIVGLRHA